MFSDRIMNFNAVKPITIFFNLVKIIKQDEPDRKLL